MLNLLIASLGHMAYPGNKRTLYLPHLTAWLITAAIFGGCSSIDTTESSDGISPELSPQEELRTFRTDPGLKVELVASEPHVQDPVVCTFDEDGRLWVVEMRAYMPDMDGDGERAANGRISVLEDTDGDGVMDKSTVYLDSLIMPRALAIVRDGVLVAYEEALWMTSDDDGDLVADRRTLIDRDYAGSDLPEHAGNGLWRGIDNWYYNAKSRLRYRFRNGEWIRDSTEFRGQWGLSHDDVGRLYYNYNWSPLHADLVPPNYLSRNKNYTPVTGLDQGLTLNKRVYPARATPAVNRGYIPGILDEEGRLAEFTAACSPFVYRGTSLSPYYGNAFVCEPSGNLIKRYVLTGEGLQLAAHDPDPGTEFFASTDERFRPVHLAQGPDGALYIADMYRGLIQHKAYLTPYLREQTAQRGLVLPIHRGRIWRVSSKDADNTTFQKLSTRSSAELVYLLSSNDGWYRDMAQRLLVERSDEQCVPLLQDVVTRKDNSELGRFHALWTLEGLEALDPDILFSLIHDSHHLIASTAIRLLEPLARKNTAVRSKLQSILNTAWKQAPIQQVLQITFTAKVLDNPGADNLLKQIITHYDTSALIRDAVISSIGNREYAFMNKLLASRDWQQQKPSQEIFLETLVSSIVRKRDPAELKTLLGMLDVEKAGFGWKERTILTGMSIQGYGGKVVPLRLPSAPRILERPELEIADSQLHGIAALFEWPGSVARDTTGHNGSTLTDKQKEQYAVGRKFYLGSCSGCHGNEGEGVTRFAPPLRGSEWVTGDSTRLILILLQGIEGPMEVAGKRYAEPEILPVMPGHSTLDDGTIAAILTYIRNSWGNRAEPINRRSVGRIRMEHKGRVLPWSPEELNQHIDELSAEE